MPLDRVERCADGMYEIKQNTAHSVQHYCTTCAEPLHNLCNISAHFVQQPCTFSLLWEEGYGLLPLASKLYQVMLAAVDLDNCFPFSVGQGCHACFLLEKVGEGRLVVEVQFLGDLNHCHIGCLEQHTDFVIEEIRKVAIDGVS